MPQKPDPNAYLGDDWITVEEAAAILRRSTRQVHRLASEENRIRTEKVSYRKLFYRPDVERLAVELRSADAPPPKPRQELVIPSDMLDYLREKDQQIAQTQTQLQQAMLTIGKLQAEVERRVLPEDVEQLRAQLAQMETERAALQEQLAAAQAAQEEAARPLPWWRRLFGN